MIRQLFSQPARLVLMAALAAGLLAAAALTDAASSANYRLEPAAVDAAGGDRSAADYQLWDALGECAAGPGASADYNLFSGIGLSDSRPPVTAKELRDHLLGRAALTGQRLHDADVNNDGQIDAADLVMIFQRNGE